MRRMLFTSKTQLTLAYTIAVIVTPCIKSLIYLIKKYCIRIAALDDYNTDENNTLRKARKNSDKM